MRITWFGRHVTIKVSCDLVSSSNTFHDFVDFSCKEKFDSFTLWWITIFSTFAHYLDHFVFVCNNSGGSIKVIKGLFIFITCSKLHT